MNGLIIDDNDRDYTSLKNVFDAIENEQKNYNWLITAIEYAPVNPKIKLYEKPYTWITGEDLTKLANDDDGFWIWGVFSGFAKNITKEDVLKSPLPFADGYTGFWNADLTIQHPLASIELVEWDGGLFLAITENQVILNRLKESFPASQDLKKYNLEP